MVLVIGISGPSGAGKTTVANAISRELHDANILSLDWYFRYPESGEYSNYWDVRCYDAEKFLAHVCELKNGRPIQAPQVEFVNFTNISPPHHIVFARKLARDMKERNRNLKSVLNQWSWMVDEWGEEIQKMPLSVHVIEGSDSPIQIIMTSLCQRRVLPVLGA